MSLLRQVNAWLFDSAGTPFVLDKSGNIPTVGELQNAVHNGMAYGFTKHGTIAATTTLIMLGVAGARQVHFDGFMCDISQGNFLLELWEAPTVATLGTQQVAQARNRASANTSQMLIYAGGTVSANGTLIHDDLLIAIGQGADVSGGTAGLDDGFVLKANTTYMIKMINNASSTTTYNAKFAWHEATYTV